FLETTKHGTGDRNRVLLFNTSHDHAEMLGFDDDGHSFRVNLLADRFGDLGRKTFLNLKGTGKHVHKARNLAQANDLAIRNVSDVTLAEKRQEMMFAKA